MLFDDDYPDYFLADDEEKKPAEADRGVIDFGAEDARRDDAADDEDEPWGGGLRLLAVVVAIVAVAAIFGYIRYVRPEVDDALMTVRVESVEKRGTVFKRFEAVVTDVQTGRPQEVSIDGDGLGRRLQEAQCGGETVRLRYRRYRTALPWRGESATEVYEIADGSRR